MRCLWPYEKLKGDKWFEQMIKLNDERILSMKKYALVGILTLFSFLGFSQSSAEVGRLLELVETYKSENIDSVNKFTNQLLIIAKESKDKGLEAKSQLNRIESLILFNRFDLADSILSTIAVEDKANRLSVDYYLAKGKILNKKNENDEALEFFYKALDKNSEGGLDYLIPEIYAEIASVLRENNDLENCTKYYRYALEEARKKENIDLQIKICVQMCKVYNGWVTVNIDSSVYYGEMAMQIATQANDEYGYANAISIAAAPIIRDGQYRRGLDLSREALGFADKYNFSLQTKYYLTANQGFAFEGLKLYDSALYFMKQAGELRPSSLDYPRLKYRVFKAQGKHKEALEAFEIYWAKSDSTLRNRNQNRLSSLQARYEANLKEQELASLTQTTELQELQLSQQRYLLFGLVVVVVFLAIGGVMIYRQRKLRQAQAITQLELKETQKRLELEQQYRASELKAIRSQMNPHFVFNALNSIQEYIMTNEKKLAGKYLGKFADLMRVYLQHSQVKTVALREEIEALSLYLELEKLRFEETLDCSIQIEENVDTELSIPSLLIQPYVENAIKHGLLHKQGKRELTIVVKQDDSKQALLFEVIDNGIGRKRSQEINQMRDPDHKSFATHALKSRIELLNHDRLNPIIEKVNDVDANSENPGTKVMLELPIEELVPEAQKRHSEIEA